MRGEAQRLVLEGDVSQRVAEEQVESGTLRPLLRAPRHVDEQGVLEVREHHPEAVARADREGARGRVANETERGD